MIPESPTRYCLDSQSIPRNIGKRRAYRDRLHGVPSQICLECEVINPEPPTKKMLSNMRYRRKVEGIVPEKSTKTSQCYSLRSFVRGYITLLLNRSHVGNLPRGGTQALTQVMSSIVE